MKDVAYPDRRSAWWVIAVLFFASIVSVIDRSILNIVVDPVKADLGISDIQISLLQGLAFGLFYATMGLPLGLAADRVSRRMLIAVGIAVWSLGTIGGGFAHSFGSLFAARLLVGLGEAALAPAAISLIADLFPPDRRGRPISIFITGQAIASGLAISVTSLIVAAAASGHFRGVPILADLVPWRIAFVVCGATGLIVAVAMLTATEPPRRRERAQDAANGQMREGLSYLARNWRIFVPLYLGFALCFMAAYGAGAWTPAMLTRSFHATPAQLGAWLGPLSMMFAITGPWIGGTLIDRYARRGNRLAKQTILIVAPLCVIPSAMAFAAPGFGAAAFLVASSSAIIAVIGTTMFATLQVIIPGGMRGFAVALTGLVNTILGATSGPWLVAQLTERVFRKPEMVGWSIASVVIPALLIASLLFALARLALKRQMQRSGEAAALSLAD